MEESMLPENQRSAEEAFRALDAQLADLSAAAKSLRENRPSWADNVFHPGRRAQQEADFGAALVSALKELRTAIRSAVADQKSKITDLERQLSDLRTKEFASLQTEWREHQAHQKRHEDEERQERHEHEERRERQQRQEYQEQLGRLAREQTEAMSNRAAELQEQIEKMRLEEAAKVEQLDAGQKDLANEFRERIQHLLDEQRVSIRQLALKASEDAVLSDRARRATELKLEELAKRLPPAPPA
jgi:hypothetical protein